MFGVGPAPPARVLEHCMQHCRVMACLVLAGTGHPLARPRLASARTAGGAGGGLGPVPWSRRGRAWTWTAGRAGTGRTPPECPVGLRHDPREDETRRETRHAGHTLPVVAACDDGVTTV